MDTTLEDKQEITAEDIEKFLAIHGQKGVKTLSLLSKNNDFYQAITDKLGQSLMMDVMTQMEFLLNKIIEDKSSLEDRAEYRALKKLLLKWIAKIKAYQELKEKVKQRR